MAGYFTCVWQLVVDFILHNKRILASVYGLYIFYAIANHLILPSRSMDPIFILTGLSRTTQFLAVSMVFGILLLIWGLAGKMRRHLIDLNSNCELRRGIVLLFVFIFLNSLAASLRAVFDDVSSEHWMLLFTWVFIVLVVQSAIIYAMLLLIQKSWVHLVLLAVLSTFNFFALYLALSGRFSTLPINSQIIFVFFIFLSCISLFALIGKHVLSLRNVNFVLGVTALSMFVFLVFSVLYAPRNDSELASFADIQFHTTPNIHVLAVDALIPISLAQKHMGLSELPYYRVLDDKNKTAVVYKNAFSSRITTKLSLNSLMRLAHTDYYREDHAYFTGRANSPVTQAFHSNGYRIWTGYNSSHFGRKGPFVDFNHPGQDWPFLHSTLCRLALQNPFKYFGVCYFMSLITDEGEPKEPWADQIIDIISRSAHEYATPVFTLHYIRDHISHVTGDFRLSDQRALEQYIELYRTGALKISEMMVQLRDLVESDDKPSIFIVIGDHGPYLSSGINPDDDESFFVQDRYGILAAILVNETDCSAKQLKHYTPSFATPERILAGVMRCLTHDPVYFDTLMEFEEDFSFEEFLYE